jgi:hypothetical protein
MSEDYNCGYCNKTFSSKSSLNLHIKSVCNKQDNILLCLYCSLSFSRKYVLDKHLNVCPKKNEYTLNQEILRLKEEQQKIHEEHTTQINKLKEDYQKLQEEYTKYRSNSSIMYQSVKEQNIELNKRIEYYKGRIKTFQDKDKLESSKPVPIVNNINTTHNTINNNLYIQNLEPITDELIRETGKKVGMMDLKEGAPGIMRKFHPVLKDKIICTDASRNSLLYNYNGKLKRDTRGRMISDKIISSTESQYLIYKDEIERYYSNLDPETMTDTERSRKDIEYENFKAYSKAVNNKTEFSKRKLTKNIVKIIVSVTKTKSQFEETVRQRLLTTDDQSQEPEITEPVVQQNKSFNKVVSTKQTLIDGRTFELHLDASGNTLYKFRLRSSGEPYLTDEETDPDSRIASDNDSDIDFDQEIDSDIKFEGWNTKFAT